MNPTESLMEDLEEAIALGSARRREITLRQVTDLLVGDIDRLSDEQVAIFDGVIARLAQGIEREALIELARRLAPLRKAPPGVLSSLAHDDIEVAQLVLIHSPRLRDSDLLGIAMARGSDHRQAIALRSEVSESVAEVLVAQGDRPVLHALASNAGVRLSPESAALLVDRALLDKDLQVMLKARPDLPEDQVHRLLDLAPAAARPKLADETPAKPRSAADQASAWETRRAPTPDAGSLEYREALDTIGAITLMRPVDEEDVAGFAEQERLEEVICAISFCADLSLTTAERLFTVADSDLILLVGKAKGWSWATLRSLLGLRDRDTALPQNATRLAVTFEDLDPKTAQRVLRFVRRRDHSIPA